MFIEIGQFLNQRLSELGIDHIFGLPGDFNLSYLEQIEEDTSLEFIGNCNELNAAYAADGYARSNGVAALVTTYGVGDLSAINGIAGAYAENVPVILISGIPPLHAVNRGELIHHTLVDGNYDNIMNCMKEFTVAQTRLTPEKGCKICLAPKLPFFDSGIHASSTNVVASLSSRRTRLEYAKSVPIPPSISIQASLRVHPVACANV